MSSSSSEAKESNLLSVLEEKQQLLIDRFGPRIRFQKSSHSQKTRRRKNQERKRKRAAERVVIAHVEDRVLSPEKETSKADGPVDCAPLPAPIVKSREAVITDKLKGTSWCGAVVKSQRDHSYVEIYTYYLYSNGSCKHHVSLVRNRVIMGDHIINNARWKVEKREGNALVLTIIADTLPSNFHEKIQTLCFTFDIHDRDGELILSEREDSPNLIMYRMRDDGKTREKISCLYPMYKTHKSLLDVFPDRKKIHDKCICKFRTTLNHLDRVYTCLDMDINGLYPLIGKWSVLGQDVEYSNIEIISPTVVHINGEEYEARTKHSYKLKDPYRLRDHKPEHPMTTVKLIPKNTDLRCLTLGIYRSGERYLLVRPKMGYKDSNSARKEVVGPMYVYDKVE